MWRQHQRKLAVSCLLLSGALTLALQLGQWKGLAAIDWLDVLGEGTALLVVSGWLWLILASRPAGRVTEWLYYGSLLLVSSYFLNLLDEFLHYPPDQRLLSWLESLPAPVGMVVLTIGLVGWHQEQRAIDRQLRGRELFLRDHRLLDPLTQLYGPEYLYAVLQRDISLHQSSGQSLCLLVLDIQQFSDFNRRYGVAAGDTLLCRLAEMLSNQLRDRDLICRFSGDCFIALLPETTLAQAQLLADHLQLQLRKWSGQPALPGLTLFASAVSQTTARAAIDDALQLLQRQRQAGRSAPAAQPAAGSGHG